ncbi:MAG: hypothetical protein IPM46_15995 [Flavobacteriales bacterium]|nr:hypothetical protein [Flavobacteriales bacterium]
MEGARGRNRLSLFSALALWAMLAAVVLRSPPTNILSWDTFGYHLYLPATFIHHDPGISDAAWVHGAMETYHSSGTLYQISELPDGRWVNKYPLGLAMLWSPFFAAGHLVAGITGAPQDGFSRPYQWALIIAGVLFLLVGLLTLRKVLLHFFSERISIGVLVLIVAGTNFFHQATQGTGMPHIFLFTLGAGVLWRTIQWRAHGRLRDAALIGFLLGLLVVSRPSEIVWALVPLLVSVRDAERWRAFIRARWAERRHYFVMAATATLACLPQLLYWKWMTGRWLYMSYNNPGEGFEFFHPYTWEVLFSFRKGWYIYTPLMVVATLGIIALWRARHQLRWAVVAFFVLNLWIVSSWSCWWYADSFGQRALVQSYALMALPLGAALHWMKERSARLRWGTPLLLLIVAFNLFQTWQVNQGVLHTSRMTWPAYSAAFGKTNAPPNLPELLLVERSYTGATGTPDPARYTRRRMAVLHFSEENDPAAGEGSEPGLLSKERAFSPAWRSTWQRITDRDHVWLEVSCKVQRPVDGSAPGFSLVTTYEHRGMSYAYQAKDVDLSQIAPGEWTVVRLWHLSPEVRRPDDAAVAYCWLRDTLPVRVEELAIHLHEPKP